MTHEHADSLYAVEEMTCWRSAHYEDGALVISKRDLEEITGLVLRCHKCPFEETYLGHDPETDRLEEVDWV